MFYVFVELKLMNSRSVPKKRGLPIPVNFDLENYLNICKSSSVLDKYLGEAQKMVFEQAAILIDNDISSKVQTELMDFDGVEIVIYIYLFLRPKKW